MSVYQASNDALLTMGRRVIQNSQSDLDIAEAVAQYGYDADTFDDGEALLARFSEAIQHRQSQNGRQLSATQALNEARKAFHRETYMPHVTVARVAYPDPGTQRRLGIDGKRPLAFGAYIQEARRFYTTLRDDPDLYDGVQLRGITTAVIDQALAALAELESLDQKQEHRKARAQQATRARNAVREEVEKWLSDYLKIARVALVHQPDRLEQLGIRVPARVG